MLSFKKKLDPNLITAIKGHNSKNHRVIIHCKYLPEKIKQKLKSNKIEIIHSISLINCICANISKKMIERLIEYPEIDYISFDTQAFLCASSVTSANGIYHDNRYKLSGKGITVGIVDSGVYPHPDLKNPRNKISCFLDILNNLEYPYDDNGHGTFISGIISSSGYNSNGLYKGIAENSNIYMVKAFNKLGRGFISDILFSIETLLSESEKYNIKVLCLPFELVDSNKFILLLFDSIFKHSISKNIIPIVPSGHNGNTENSMRGIATLESCITVGGLDSTHSLKAYPYSSGGSSINNVKPDLSASCVNIYSLNSDKEYISQRNGRKIYPHTLKQSYVAYTGTSISCAFIAGICTLLFENNNDLKFEDILSLLKLSCNMINESKFIQGAGAIEFNNLLP
ncbi:S8 family serine peptidase [Clostridium sediminicola]|uniref:S8 family serine peptidase n=1 Tax=Clostridium sediminicola TaxID=3114879 RepID=UPI0031F224A1